MLAPDKSMWGKSREEFKKLYISKLESIGEQKIKSLLREIGNRANGRDVVLLCYEDVRDPSQHCHRTTLAEWISEKYGLKVEELHDPSPVKMKKVEKEIKEKEVNTIEQEYKQIGLFDLI